MARSNLVNAVDVALADPVISVDSTIRVTDPELLPPIPFYLVVDPFSLTTLREYMFATAINVDVLTVTRNLDGSESTIHDAGDIVRITYVAQHLDDLWDDIEAIPPPIPQTYLHEDLTDVVADQHHTRYTDAEAIAAVGNPGIGVFLPLTGGTLTGILDMSNNRLTNLGNGTLDQDALNIGSANVRYLPRVNANIVGVSTDANGDFAVPTGFTPSSALVQSAQVDFPSIFAIRDFTSVQVVWRAYDPNGIPRGNTVIVVSYQIFGV